MTAASGDPTRASHHLPGRWERRLQLRGQARELDLGGPSEARRQRAQAQLTLCRVPDNKHGKQNKQPGVCPPGHASLGSSGASSPARPSRSAFCLPPLRMCQGGVSVVIDREARTPAKTRICRRPRTVRHFRRGRDQAGAGVAARPPLGCFVCFSVSNAVSGSRTKETSKRERSFVAQHSGE